MTDSTVTQSPSLSPVRIVTILVATLSFIAFLSFPNALPNGTLDSSWSAAIASFFGTNVQAGKDYIFTYGPLGFLLSAFFDPGTFGLKWLYEVAIKGYIVFEIVRLSELTYVDGERRPWWRVLLPLVLPGIAWIFSIYSGGVYSTDAWAYVVLIVLATSPLLDRNFHFGRVLVTVVIVAILSLAKATLTALALPVILICAMRTANQHKKAPWWQSPLLLFPVLWICLWVLLRQNIANIIPFFQGSISVATGYSEAMAFATPVYRNSPAPLGILIGCVFLLLGAVRLQHYTLSKENGEKWLNALYLIFLGLVVLLAYKHGITRGGNHTLIPFLTYTFLASFLLGVLPSGTKPAARNIVLVLATIGSLFGVLRGDDGWFHRDAVYPPFVGGLKPLFNPIGFHNEKKTAIETDDGILTFPETQRIVGDKPIGMWSYEQGLLLLNHLQYRSHPTFQGYNAYSSYLQKKDAEFWQSDRAPEYLLFAQKSIDFRYPTLDNGPSFAIMISRYRPVLSEHGYLLLKRQATFLSLEDIARAHDAAQSRTITNEKWISLPTTPPGSVQMVSISIRPTLAGITRRLLFKPADVLIAARSAGSDDATIHRLPITMAAQGFVIAPYLPDTESVLSFYTGQPTASPIEQFALSFPPDSAPCYEPEIDVRLYTVPFPGARP